MKNMKSFDLANKVKPPQPPLAGREFAAKACGKMVNNDKEKSKKNCVQKIEEIQSVATI